VTTGREKMTEFEIGVEKRGSMAILRPAGELDLAAAPKVEATIVELAGNSPDTLVIDLRQVTFLDSSGLRSLITARREGAQKWELKLIRGPRQVQRVFELTGMDHVFDFVDASECD
jgi:anti-anti-sigma factor